MKKILRFMLCVIAVLLIVLVSFLAYCRIFVERPYPKAAAPDGTRFVEIGNGEEIAYRVAEDPQARTSIIFVGGLSGWSGTWQRTMDSLGDSLQKEDKHYNLIALDLPPFGYSIVDVTRGYSRTAQSQRINDFRRALGLDSVILVGHSYGAGPLTEAAMARPGGIEKLVIIDGVLNVGDSVQTKRPGPLFSDPFMSTFVTLVSHNVPLVERQLRGFVFRQDHIDRELTRLYIQPFAQKGNGIKVGTWIREYLHDPLGYRSTDPQEYRNLAVPLRIVWGEEDSLTPVSLGERLHELVPDSKLVRLPGVGHIPMIEDYEKSDAAILQSILN